MQDSGRRIEHLETYTFHCHYFYEEELPQYNSYSTGSGTTMAAAKPLLLSVMFTNIDNQLRCAYTTNHSIGVLRWTHTIVAEESVRT